jgi:hypothetical protein
MFELIRGLLNPTAILALILVWSGTSVYRGVTEWVNQRKVVRPYVEAVAQRDRAARFKDELLEALAKDKEIADAEATKWREAVEAYERTRQPVPGSAGDCVWSPDDIRVLNSARARRRN